jgi:hypothetical protein
VCEVYLGWVAHSNVQSFGSLVGKARHLRKHSREGGSNPPQSTILFRSDRCFVYFLKGWYGHVCALFSLVCLHPNIRKGESTQRRGTPAARLVVFAGREWKPAAHE